MNKDVIEFFQRQPAPERCFYCGVKLVRLRMESTPHPMARFVYNLFTRDHVEPMSLGGSKRKHNIVPCCRKCNNAKGKRTAEQYRRRLYGDKRVEFYAEWLHRKAVEEETDEHQQYCMAVEDHANRPEIVQGKMQVINNKYVIGAEGGT